MSFVFFFCLFVLTMVAQMVKRLSTMLETQVQALGWEDPLEKEMAIHSSTIAWRIPWTEEPGRLQSMGSQRVGHNWAISVSQSRDKSTQSIFCSIEWPWGTAGWMGGWSTEGPSHEFSTPSPSSEREGGLEMELIVDHAYVICLHNIPIAWGSRNFQTGEHLQTRRVTHPNSTGTEAPASQTLPDLAICISSGGSFVMSFNKLVTVSTYFPLPYESFSQINQNWGACHGNLWFVATLDRNSK